MANVSNATSLGKFRKILNSTDIRNKKDATITKLSEKPLGNAILHKLCCFNA